MIEILVVLIMLIVLARFIWAAEAMALEETLFNAIGLDGWKKYVVLGPLGLWLITRLVSREARRTKEVSTPLVRPSVAIASIVILVVGISLAVLAS